MAIIADYYPAGMSECERNGINGNCGIDCSVFQMGGCESQWEEIPEPDPDPCSEAEPVLSWKKWGF